MACNVCGFRLIGNFIRPYAACVLLQLGILPCYAEELQETQPTGFQYIPGGLRDPFIPLVRDGRLTSMIWEEEGEEVSTTIPVLYGILWDSGGHSIALIDDGEYLKGQIVNGYTIEEISQHTVVLTQDEKRVMLELPFDEANNHEVIGSQKGGDLP